jgi:ACS family sodium-dependent inorganic phosphate cotransporter-like MFS transporter 5
VFGIGVLCTSVLTLLTPLAARWHVNALIALRILEGIGEGVTFPAMHTLFARWAPPAERSGAVTFVYAGCQLGTVIGMPLSGVLCDYGFAGGWPSVFYVFGIIGCVWSVLWFTLCYDTPAVHPYILPDERDYIESSTASTKQGTFAIPWRNILTSMPVWACVAVHFANNWGYYTLLTCLPKFMNDVLHFNVASNGILSGLPYLACWILMTAGGVLADRLRAPGRLSTGTVRRLFCFVGLIAPAVFLIISGFLGCDRAAVVVVVVLAVGFSGLAQACYGVNHLDLSPTHAGPLMGLTNMMATIPGFVGPQVVGVLTYHKSTRVEWQKVFYIAAGVYGFGTLIFLIFGSGDMQPWAESQERRADAAVKTNTRSASTECLVDN